MNYSIRQVKQGDELTLAHIQVESWKAAFHDILPEEVLTKYTNIENSANMYRQLLEENKGKGFMLLRKHSRPLAHRKFVMRKLFNL